MRVLGACSRIPWKIICSQKAPPPPCILHREESHEIVGLGSGSLQNQDAEMQQVGAEEVPQSLAHILSDPQASAMDEEIQEVASGDRWVHWSGLDRMLHGLVATFVEFQPSNLASPNGNATMEGCLNNGG